MHVASYLLYVRTCFLWPASLKSSVIHLLLLCTYVVLTQLDLDIYTRACVRVCTHGYVHVNVRRFRSSNSCSLVRLSTSFFFFFVCVRVVQRTAGAGGANLLFVNRGRSWLPERSTQTRRRPCMQRSQRDVQPKSLVLSGQHRFSGSGCLRYPL